MGRALLGAGNPADFPITCDLDGAASPWPGHLCLLVGADLMLRPSPRLPEAIEAIHDSLLYYEALSDRRFCALAQKTLCLLFELATDIAEGSVSDRFASATAQLVTLLDQATHMILILARLEVAQGERGEAMIALREALHLRRQIASIAGEMEAATPRKDRPQMRPWFDGRPARSRVLRRIGDTRVILCADLCQT